MLVSVHSFSDSTVGPVLLGFFGLVVAVGVGLIGWRGDRLRSPGTIDAAVSREGAFLVNNLLFAGFALVVLLGTVFPLFVEALNGQQVTVGQAVLRHDDAADRLRPALLHGRRAGAAVAQGRPGRPSPPAGGPGLGGRAAWSWSACWPACAASRRCWRSASAAFAGASALRQLVLAATASHRAGGGVWRALFGRANGGMIVHLGVVVVAVALAAASSYGQRTQLVLKPGQVGPLRRPHLHLRRRKTIPPPQQERRGRHGPRGRGSLLPGHQRVPRK